MRSGSSSWILVIVFGGNRYPNGSFSPAIGKEGFSIKFDVLDHESFYTIHRHV